MESEAAAAVSPERNGGETLEADAASLRTKVLPPGWQHAHLNFSVSGCSRASADAVCPSWSATASRMSRCECWSASLGAGKQPRRASSVCVHVVRRAIFLAVRLLKNHPDSKVGCPNSAAVHWGRSRSARVRVIPSHWELAINWRCRRKAVCHDPNSAGSSRHAMPVRVL